MSPSSKQLVKNIFALVLLVFIWPILVIGIMIPASAFVTNYLCSFVFFIYKLFRWNNQVLKTNPREFWQGAVTFLAKFWRLQGRIWHGYEIEGLENIPDSGPAILVDYHSSLPLDAGFVLSSILLEKKRRVVTIVDRSVTRMPGYQTFLEVVEQQSGSVDSCIEIMNRGDLLYIYPGGLKEASLSDENYEIVWPERAGFAKVAFATKPTIIPIFTENCRETTFKLNLYKNLCQRLYLRRKIFIPPVFGWLPVKLITHVGKPIEYDISHTVEEIVELTQEALKKLIDSNQRIPGSAFQAFLDRFR